METQDIMILIAVAVILYFLSNFSIAFIFTDAQKFVDDTIVPNLTLVLGITAIGLMVFFGRKQ